MDRDRPVKVEVEGAIGWLTLNRPDRLNALSLASFSALRQSLQQLDEDPDVRVVVIRAEGKSFCSGIDLEALAPLLGDAGTEGRERLRRRLLELQEDLGTAETIRKPVIAAVHGYCFGAGVDLLCACDVRIASSDAVFAVRETKVAMVADVGTLQRLPSIVGQGWARELALTGRNFSAEEALRMGFITRLCPDQPSLIAEAAALAGEIAASSPLAVQGVKEVSLFSRDHGVRAGLEYVAQKSSVLLFCEDLKEALRAFQEKRPPRFEGR